jgi:hypothetical protein
MQSVRSPRSRAAILIAAAAALPVALHATHALAASAPAPARSPAAPSLLSLHNVRVSSIVRPQPLLTAFPLQSPPINGFVPTVIVGLTDEQDPDDISFSSQPSSGDGATTPGGNPLPVGSPQRYFTATFDSGASTHLLSWQMWDALDLEGANRAGGYTAELQGANGSEEVEISDALGVYMTGLGNASASGSTISVKPGTMRGQWNTSLVSTYEPSILPNIIGSPMLARNQVVIRNTQPKHLTVGAETIDSPQVSLKNLNATLPNSHWVRLTLSPESPNGVAANSTYFPSLDNFNNWADNPVAPTFWAALMCNAGGGHTAGTFSNQKFLFDTGAQVTVLSQDTAASVGFYSAGPNPTTPDFFVEVAGVGGQVENIPGFYMQSLTLPTNGGPITWNNVPVIVYDLIDPSDGVGYVPGIIGMNLFTDRDIIVNGGLSNPSVGIGPIFHEWNSNTGGNWSTAAKWSSGAGMPNGLNQPATFYSAATAPQTINVDGNYTVGSISFDNANTYTLSGTGRITVNATGGEGVIYVGKGNHTIAAPMTFAQDTTVDVTPPASTLTISSDVIATSRAITKAGDGTLAMKNIRAATLAVQTGKVQVIAGPGGGAAGTSNLTTLTIAAAAQLDLTNNNLVVKNSPAGTWNGTTYTGVQGLVRAGYNEGAWDGAGGIITSSADAATGLTTLAVASAADVLGLGAGQTALWSGQTVSPGDALVMYTYGGDANLDGFISGDDYSSIDFNAGTSADGYYNGDFNYDGIISGDDYSTIDFNFAAQGAPFATSSPLVAVPEPACGFVIVAAAIAIVGVRRRRIA